MHRPAWLGDQKPVLGGSQNAPEARFAPGDPTYQPGNPPESVLAGMAPPLSEGGTTRFLKGKTGSGGVLDPRIRAAGAPRRGGLDRHSRPKTRAGHPKPILAGVAFRTIRPGAPGPTKEQDPGFPGTRARCGVAQRKGPSTVAKRPPPMVSNGFSGYALCTHPYLQRIFRPVGGL